jgi:hypothetical protein
MNLIIKAPIMELAIYPREINMFNTIQNFMDSYYSLKMKYFASDLLDEGLTPKQISDAVIVAVRIASASGIDMHKHFMPMYSAIYHEIIKDCKLSHLGYGLVLMNANPNLSVVGNFQVSVLNEFLKEEN